MRFHGCKDCARPQQSEVIYPPARTCARWIAWQPRSPSRASTCAASAPQAEKRCSVDIFLQARGCGRERKTGGIALWLAQHLITHQKLCRTLMIKHCPPQEKKYKLRSLNRATCSHCSPALLSCQ